MLIVIIENVTIIFLTRILSGVAMSLVKLDLFLYHAAMDTLVRHYSATLSLNGHERQDRFLLWALVEQ